MKMRSGLFIRYDDYDVQQREPFDRYNDAWQYAPTPGNFDPSPASPSNTSYTNIDPASPINHASQQRTAAQTNSLPLLQFGDWEEGRTYDEDPPTCIHYLIEWKPKLKELLIRKYPQRKLESDDTSVVVSATRQRGLSLRFDGTDIDWSPIEKQLSDWGDIFLAGKKLRLVISFNCIEHPQSSTVSRRTNDKRGASSATQRMLEERDQQLRTEEEVTGEPSAWKAVYTLMRCPGSCDLGPHCWQDPYGKKHYKLYRDQPENLAKYVQSGGHLQSHEDVPGMIREQIYRAEKQRLERPLPHSRTTSESSCPLITITNVLPAQTPQGRVMYVPMSRQPW
ncbi:hypothetical protein E8E15_000843 [Penicillium rubens]|nr:hypothetical protein E8E15_000843 [Penicillium rubens]